VIHRRKGALGVSNGEQLVTTDGASVSMQMEYAAGVWSSGFLEICVDHLRIVSRCFSLASAEL